MNPLGVVPALLEIRRGHGECELWDVYRAHSFPPRIHTSLVAPDYCSSSAAALDLSKGESRGTVQAICHRPQAVGGLGGVGKTQLALAFAHLH
jgi:hypothetical protein